MNGELDSHLVNRLRQLNEAEEIVRDGRWCRGADEQLGIGELPVQVADGPVEVIVVQERLAH